MIAGRVALVTGATGGIGESIVRSFLSGGWQVLAAARRQDALEQLAVRVDAGDALRSVAADVATDEGARRAADAAASWGTLDVLVNAAGWAPYRTALDAEEWLVDRVIAANLRTVIFASLAAARLMTRGGSIVNVASVTGLRPIYGRALYGAAKAGVIHFTRSLAMELAPKGIAVNAVAPGVVLTDETVEFLRSDHPAVAAMRSTSLSGTYATPGDVARLIVVIASQPRTLMTGQVIAVDAGWSIA